MSTPPPRLHYGAYAIETRPVHGSLYRQAWLIHARTLVPTVDAFIVEILNRPLGEWVSDPKFDQTVRDKVTQLIRDHLADIGIPDAEQALKEWLTAQGRTLFTGGFGHNISFKTSVGTCSGSHTCVRPEFFQDFLNAWTETITLLFYATQSEIHLSDKAYQERWGN
jgi:hypothetical protein